MLKYYLKNWPFRLMVKYVKKKSVKGCTSFVVGVGKNKIKQKFWIMIHRQSKIMTSVKEKEKKTCKVTFSKFDICRFYMEKVEVIKFNF